MWNRLLLAAGIVLAVDGCSTAPANRPGAAPRYVAVAPAPVVSAGVEITLSTDQAATVRAYMSSAYASRGRGRGRSGGLPPGIAKNLARGKPLPPGIAMSHLPAHIVTELPHLPSGFDYVVVAGKLLLVEAATQVVRQVLLDIAFGG